MLIGQHQDAWSLSVHSAQLKQSTETDHMESGEEEGITEHDYIGLSRGTYASPHVLTHTVCPKDDEIECGDTELRLGLGPYKGAESPKCKHENQQHHEQKELHFQEGHGHNPEFQSPSSLIALQRYFESGSSNSVELLHTFWSRGPGIAPGRFVIPVPKVSTVPAKRPFTETIGDNSEMATLPSDLTEMHPLGHPPIAGAGGGLHTGNTSTPSSTSAGWQHGNFCQDGKPKGSFAAEVHSCRALPPPPLFKVPPHPSMSHHNALPQPVSRPACDNRASPNPDSSGHDKTKSDAPVVGWPPVRSFRKNTLQSTAANGTAKINAAVDLHKQEDAVKGTNSCTGVRETPLAASNGSAKSGLFVKAKLDGVRICRKVDLKSYDSYDSLKSALQEMFQGFICNENGKLDLLHGNKYVLTHEDKDGDWMLVGDVPWHMFVASTVKSFRIMKASDAAGLGERRPTAQLQSSGQELPGLRRSAKEEG